MPHPDPAPSPSTRSLAVLGTIAFLSTASACADTSEQTATLDTLPLWTVVEELRIGSVDDPEYAFPDIRMLIVGNDGSIYTLDRQTPEIRKWTEDGLPAGTVGQRGEGPGEYTRPVGLGWRGDSIWVLDLGNYRISFFDPDGAFHGSLSPRFDLGSVEQTAAEIFPPRPAGPLADGTVLGQAALPSQAVVSGQATETSYHRMTVEGEILDTLAAIPVGQANSLGILRETGGTFTSQPFGDATMAVPVADGSGMVILKRAAAQESDVAEFRLTRIDLAGDTVWTRGYPYRPIPISQDTITAEIREIAGRLYEFAGERTGTPLREWESSVRDAMYVPAYYAPVSRIGQGRDGTIWLALLELQTPEGPEWLTLDADGEPIARVRVPDGFQWMTGDRTSVWGVERDELEVPYVVRYRIVEP